MESHTQAPYHLTLKSNGCLILISALSPTHLLVASKHSLGTTTETDAPAAVADAIQGLDINVKSGGGEHTGLGEVGKKSKKDKGKGKDDQNAAAVSSDAHQSEAQADAEAEAHAAVGRRWVKRTLKKVGKTEAELAAQLWKDNLSAVLEVSWLVANV
jgi:tRNA ligase